MGSEAPERGRRAPAQVRRAQIVDAAAQAILDQGHLPLAVERLAKTAGVSKALIYRHFPDQTALIDAVLEREFEALAAMGLDAAVGSRDLTTAALEAGHLYFSHVARRGPVAHYILRDLHVARRIRPDLAQRRDRAMRPLARLARRELGLSPREAVAAINLVLTIPEEAGRLVSRGDLSMTAGEALCRRLIGSSLAGMRGL